jgi:ribosomal protein S3
MGQKTNPFGFRVGVTEAHKSRWFAPKALFGELLVEDYKIRKFIDKRLNRTPPYAAVSDVYIERTREELSVIIKTARPGQVVGLKGAEIERNFDTRLGSIPLTTLQANIDYAVAHIGTTYGVIGIKVWVYKGLFEQAEDDTTTNAAGGRARARGRR